VARHCFTPAQRAAGGQRRAAQPSAADARARGGRSRAAQGSFAQHNAAIAPLGYQAAVARYGQRAILEKVCAWRRRQPGSQLERFVAAELRRLGLSEGPDADYVREVVVDLPGSPGLAALDFVVNAPMGVVVILPGARRWHGDATETIDGQDRAARDRAIDRALADYFGWTVLRLTDDCIISRPQDARRAIAAAVQYPARQAA
jgi:hypothetical protein